MIRTQALPILALALTLVSGAATAGSLTVDSYSMLNGNGKAIGGSRNYWDRCYGGVCDKTFDNQALSGGTGDLTDGIVTQRNWASVETAAGTGPYVGWHRAAVPNVTLDFFFAGTVDVDAISIHADDANGLGSVNLPAAVTISWSGGSRRFDILDPATATPQWLTFSGLGIAAVGEVQVQLIHRTSWIFVDEVSFDGRQVAARGATPGGEIPEPSSIALAGLALLTIVKLRAKATGPGTRAM